MKRIGHWTPRYIFNRIRAGWRYRRYPQKPWLAWGMVNLLDQWLRPTDLGFEWGSGRSTAWFAARLKHLTSIENHEGWFTKVQAMLVEHGVQDRTELVYATLSDAGDDCEYVRAIDAEADASLNFCLVDGRKRGACALRALPKLAVGGIVVVDDAQRYLPPVVASASPGALAPDGQPASPQWQAFAQATKDWRCLWFSDGLRDTALWIKP